MIHWILNKNYGVFQEKYYTNADIFLFPSNYDIWGLVLVEAMAHSLVCISSIHAGATSDLIVEGITGFSVDFSDLNDLEKKVINLINDRTQIISIGRKANKYIEDKFSIDQSANQFVKAITNEF